MDSYDKMEQEERWNDTEALEAFDRFERARKPVRRATRQLLSQFYKEHFAGNETVLEVGAGKGELYRQWPQQFKGRWIQFDMEPELLKHAEQKHAGHEHADDHKVCGSAYNIPIGNESVDVVCGLGSYDVLLNLEEAVEEARRVLKPSGWFFHLLDLKANPEAVFHDLKQNGTLVIYDELLSTVIHPGKEEAYERELKEWVEKPLDERKCTRWDIAKKYGYNLYMTEYFTKRLVKALELHFGSVEKKPLLGYHIGARLLCHEDKQKLYVNLSGNLGSNLLNQPQYAGLPKISKKPSCECMEVSEMQLVTARSPRR